MTIKQAIFRLAHILVAGSWILAIAYSFGESAPLAGSIDTYLGWSSGRIAGAVIFATVLGVAATVVIYAVAAVLHRISVRFGARR